MNVLSSVAIASGGRTDGDAGQRARGGQSKAPTSKRENLSYINLLKDLNLWWSTAVDSAEVLAEEERIKLFTLFPPPATLPYPSCEPFPGPMLMPIEPLRQASKSL